MQRRVIADSSANMLSMAGMDYQAVPLRVMAGDRVYADDGTISARQLVEELRSHKGRTTTACPSMADWQRAFGDAEECFCVTITSALSGSNNAAEAAAREAMEAAPGRKIFVLDSLSTGAEMTLLAERMAQDICLGMDFDEICQDIKSYQTRTHLMYCLQSLRNLAANGRVSPALAAIIGILGIRMVGSASADGRLELDAKCRGDKKALAAMVNGMRNKGYAGGQVVIDHCVNEPLAQELAQLLRAEWPEANIRIRETGVLCSYYAEGGGLMIGFESEPPEA